MNNEGIQTLNMKTVPLEWACKQIKMQLKVGNYTPVILLGKSGIGKTESIMGLAKELGIGFIELRLGNYQESDLIGLPDIRDNKTVHIIADIFPDSNDEGQGILFLDEVTSSSKGMRTACYQLMDKSRSLGQYKLPKNWMIVACGNGPDDGGDFRGMEAALLSRGMCWRIEPNLESWKKWAVKAGVHPTVVAFLSFRPNMLHCMNIDNPHDMIACPRNWVALSTQLTNMEQMYPNGVITDDMDLEYSASGCVGENVGPAFAAFYRYNKDVISPQDIIDGKVKPEALRGVSDEVLYITAQNVVHLARNVIQDGKVGAGYSVECVKKIANLMNWCIALPKARVRVDVAISIIDDLVKAVGDDLTAIVLTDEFDEKCPDFIGFCKTNNIIVQF